MKGYLGCPLCGPNVKTKHSSHLKKCLPWTSMLRWEATPILEELCKFDGQPKVRLVPSQISTTVFFRKAKEREEWLNRKVQVTNPKNDPIHIHGVNIMEKHILLFTILECKEQNLIYFFVPIIFST